MQLTISLAYFHIVSLTSSIIWVGWLERASKYTDHVLTESNFSHVDTNLLEEQANSRQEVSKSLVVNETILDGLSDSSPLHGGLTRELSVPVKEGQLNVLDFMESIMLLAALGVNDCTSISVFVAPQLEKYFE